MHFRGEYERIDSLACILAYINTSLSAAQAEFSQHNIYSRQV